jgi:hypothetical protein
MKKEKILEALEELAGKLNFKIRHEKGDFSGGVCLKEDEPLIMINKRHMIDRKINVLAREMAPFDLTSFPIPPAVLKIIESERQRASVEEVEEVQDQED